MLARLRSSLTYASVVSTIALCLVVGGGSALAADTIFSSDIVDGEVKNNDLAANAVGSAKIADRSVKNADLGLGASSSNTIADGGIQGVDVKPDTRQPDPQRQHSARVLLGPRPARGNRLRLVESFLVAGLRDRRVHHVPRV
jgi:hypothetical protein